LSKQTAGSLGGEMMPNQIFYWGGGGSKKPKTSTSSVPQSCENNFMLSS